MNDEDQTEPAAGESPAFRVVRLGEDLRRDIRSRREATGQTVRAFVAEAIEHELPALVVALAELGLSARAGSAGRPARLPLSAAHLSGLRAAAGSSGLPASLLLRLSLSRLARRKRRRTGTFPPQPGAERTGRTAGPDVATGPAWGLNAGTKGFAIEKEEDRADRVSPEEAGSPDGAGA